METVGTHRSVEVTTRNLSAAKRWVVNRNKLLGLHNLARHVLTACCASRVQPVV
jgi:hypothetical protein